MSLSSPSHLSAQTESSAMKYPQFLLLGDSIIQYGSYLRDGVSLVAGLAEYCDRRVDIINRGLSGYNTANEMVVLPRLIPPPSCAKVDYLLVLFGANDACLPTSPTKQHVSLDKYRENLKSIITHPSILAHNPKILLVTPPPINEYQLMAGDKSKGYTDITRSSDVTAQYASVVREIAAEYQDKNVVLIDLWAALMNCALKADKLEDPQAKLGSRSIADSPGLRSLLVDGLHLTGAGYSVFLNEILPVVGQEWKEEPANDPKSWIFPHWSIAPRFD